MECVVKLAIKEEIFIAKLREIDSNLEAARKNYETNRYSQKFDKNGNLDGTVDYKELIDRLLSMKEEIQNQLNIDSTS